MQKITPVLLAGGSGSRLWPLSRRSYPKQFVELLGKFTLFQKSAIRYSNCDYLRFSPNIIVTQEEYRFIVGEQLVAVGMEAGPILLEPVAKNTAPAILAAALYALQSDPDAILIVSPSDQIISDTQNFHAAIECGLKHVSENKIVTFGIRPTHPETGYGYLQLEDHLELTGTRVKRFHEKPDSNTAEKMYASNQYLWNSGIFMFQAKVLASLYNDHLPSMYKNVTQAIKGGVNDLDFFRLHQQSWSECENISIDYAIMEKIDSIVAIPISDGWSDLGGWDSVWREMGPDQNGVAVSENAISINCRNSLFRSESANQQLVGMGVEDILAIAMPDAVLVTKKSMAQEVKNIVPILKEHNVSQAEKLQKDFRPWGWFETLTISNRFQVKRICVKPGGILSLQSHYHRSEHWIVVEGTAEVTISETTKLLSEGESVYIPLGAVHRMANPGKVPMILIEVQTGVYLEEDDIVRYDDIYSRV